MADFVKIKLTFSNIKYNNKLMAGNNLLSVQNGYSMDIKHINQGVLFGQKWPIKVDFFQLMESILPFVGSTTNFWNAFI